MGKMEWSLLESRKQGHEDIAAVLRNFEQLGYMVSSISHKENGALEVVCYPPRNEEGSMKESTL